MRVRHIVVLIALLLVVNCAQDRGNAVSTSNAQAKPSPSPSATTKWPPTEVDLTINGVRSGTSDAKVKQLLGKPKSDRRGQYDDCAGYVRYLTYDGLIVEVISSEQDKGYTVTHMELTSSKYEIAPGLHIGDPVSRVRELYGEPVNEDGESISYVTKGNEGWVGFYFRDGKIVRVEMTETLC